MAERRRRISNILNKALQNSNINFRVCRRLVYDEVEPEKYDTPNTLESKNTETEVVTIETTQSLPKLPAEDTQPSSEPAATSNNNSPAVSELIELNNIKQSDFQLSYTLMCDEVDPEKDDTPNTLESKNMETEVVTIETTQSLPKLPAEDTQPSSEPAGSKEPLHLTSNNNSSAVSELIELNNIEQSDFQLSYTLMCDEVDPEKDDTPNTLESKNTETEVVTIETTQSLPKLPAEDTQPSSEPSGSKEPLPSSSFTDIQPNTSNTQPTKNPQAKRTRKCKRNKHYYDFYNSDEEDFTAIFGEYVDSDTYIPSSGSSDSENEISNNRKRSKKSTRKENVSESLELNEVGESGMKKKRINKKKENRLLRASGKAYLNRSGKEVSAKEIKPNPCSGKKCGNDCGDITEERRKNIFEFFWNLPVVRRKDWLVSMTQKNAIKRKRNKESEKRLFTYNYSITEGEDKRRVCLQFLATTLDLSPKFIQRCVTAAAEGLSQIDNRGKCEPHNKTSETTMIMVENFIKNLPVVPSHYCRKESNRVYLPSEMKNISNLYNMYKKKYIDQGIDVVSERVFRSVFNKKFNIGFHVPKKDKCVKCLKFERAKDDPSIAEEKKQHDIEREESYNRFKSHQKIYKDDNSTLCASFDLQKVLNTPYGNSMLLFYTRKLAVYNLCIYENGTRRVFCFYWEENHGKRGANEIASILNKYVNMVDERGTVKNLLLYCDCCPGQNRNKTVLGMLHSTLQTCKTIETIQINFLLTGHTYMPVDSVHAVIERNLKNTLIYAPSQWFTVFSTARIDPEPYNVAHVSFNDFVRWDTVGDKYFKGNLAGKISKMRIVTIKKKKNEIYVKNSMNTDARKYSIETQNKAKIMPALCYRSQLPIAKPKLDDLLKLCRDKVIPEVFENEYKSLITITNVKETLPETDIEDDDEE